MSYILDALNKSEEEKKAYRTPSLNTIHQRPGRSNRGGVPWTIVISALILITLVALVTWLIFFSQTRVQPEKVTRSSHAVEPSPRPSMRTQNTPVYTPTEQPPELRSSAAIKRTEPIAKTPIPGGDGKLPSVIADEIAAIRFSSHIYASDATLRMVVINGQALRELERFGSGLELSQITEDGVVIRHQTHSVPVSVLSQWADD